ncbi:SCO family protein [Luteibaculum oceani]|uniref:SCO family protein n=1 Tax=Luteibaculum oceani TaxID=1294296 RepID=A0A5C6UY97_9FLAO|nr:SCO family protein [Luteibaculum oceani]TXC78473.1 SCO family protein [Luteibaculum oceani]
MKLSSGGIKILLFLLILSGGITFAYQILKPSPTLKIYQPSDINPRLVDSTLQAQQQNHTIADFNLIDQDSNQVSRKDFQDKIIVADFFFTTCPSICPKMSANLKMVSDHFVDETKLVILSHTVTPEIDSPSVLKQYAKEYDAKDNWIFLTGDRKEIYNLARRSYFAAIDEPSTEGPDFVHTENFVLVDKKGQLRGFYDGTSKIDSERLIADIQVLLNDE